MPEEILSKFPFMEAGSLKRAAVVCHRNADADAYLSAYALSFLLRKLSPGCEVDIATPDGMTTLTKKLSLRFPHKVVEEPEEDYDLYVAVDVGDEELLKGWRGKMEDSEGVKVLVDHHPQKEGLFYDHAIVDEEATSAAEVVCRLYKELGVSADRQTSQALLEAVMFDSSHLAIAKPDGLRTVVALLDSGADLAQARRELRSEPDYGEVLAKLKGAQRLKIYKVGDWVVATTLVGSFQAHVARALLYLGSDAALVGGESEGETRVSMRSTQRFADKTKVQLGSQVAKEATERMGGHGGGHATAASFSTGADEERALKVTLEVLSGMLGSEPRPVD